MTANAPMALKYYRLAASHNNPPGLRQMGNAYEFGRGVLRDPVQALTYYEKSASAGDQLAMRRMADVYRVGELGQAPDPVKAAQWKEKADTRYMVAPSTYPGM